MSIIWKTIYIFGFLRPFCPLSCRKRTSQLGLGFNTSDDESENDCSFEAIVKIKGKNAIDCINLNLFI